MALDRPRFLLAVVTESRMAAAPDDPAMAQFAATFDVVNRVARQAPGYRWQLTGDSPGHPVPHPDDPLLVVTVSAWTDYASLHRFVYHSTHGRALLRRAEWFRPGPQPSTALWWMPPDDPPTLTGALARLGHLRRHGPTPRAFSLHRRFDAAGRPEPPRSRRPS